MAADVQRAHRVIEAMVRRRGYTAVERRADGHLQCTGGPRAPLLVLFLTAMPKLGIKPLRAIEDLLEANRCMIVYRGSITTFAKQHLATNAATVETFSLEEVQIDLMEHVLVPPHRALKMEEVRRRGLVVGKLPALLTTDAVVRWHAWPRRTVVEVTRVSSEGHEYKDYRAVVAAA